MAMLKNQKHELFAQAIARGESGRSAYLASGYNVTETAADACASRLLSSAKVSSRVAELRQRMETVEKTVLTKAWVIEETISLQRAAKAAGAYGPAAKCLELLAREVLAFVERKEVGAPGEFSTLSEDELVAIIREVQPGQLGKSGASGKRIRPPRSKETLQ